MRCFVVMEGGRPIAVLTSESRAVELVERRRGLRWLEVLPLDPLSLEAL